MKLFAIAIAALFAFTLNASAQQVVFGTGAFSQSESSQGFQGNSGSGVLTAGNGLGLSSNVQTMSGEQNSAGFALAGTTGLTSGVVTGTSADSNVGIGSTSFGAGAGGALTAGGGTNTNSAFSGSASNGFAGFGFTN